MWIGSKTEIQRAKKPKEKLEKSGIKKNSRIKYINTKLCFENSEKRKKGGRTSKINKELEAFALYPVMICKN
jgi:hypothetical protein